MQMNMGYFEPVEVIFMEIMAHRYGLVSLSVLRNFLKQFSRNESKD